METIKITKKELETLKPKNRTGSEAIIYYKNEEVLYKIYHNPKDYTEEKVKALETRKENITLTTLPHGLIYLDDTFCGIAIKHHIKYHNFALLKRLKDISLKQARLQQLLKSIQELTQNGIYPTDLNDFNAMFHKTNPRTEVVDLDGKDTLVTTVSNRELIHVLSLLKDIILETYLHPFDIIEAHQKKEAYLERFPIPTQYIKNQNLSYEMLQSLTEELAFIKKR